jgi:photosystem II stability/assembly factor-like uncharacterized protein
MRPPRGGRPAVSRPAVIRAIVTLAAVSLAAVILAACGTAPAQPRTSGPTRTAAQPAAPARTSAQSRATPASLSSVFFLSAAHGYGLFVTQNGRRCASLVARTADGGARFTAPVPVGSSWSCAQSPPATTLVFDTRGDGLLSGPGLFATHNGGRAWSRLRQHGSVLGIVAWGHSFWLIRTSCPDAVAPATGPAGRTCRLRLLESANGGRTWRSSPEQPPGATDFGTEAAVAQIRTSNTPWLLRTGPSAGYVLARPGPAGRAPLWFTGNGGRTWSRRQIPCDGMSVALTAAPDGTLTAVCAGEPGTGNQLKITLRSRNGGRSWTAHPACRRQFSSCAWGPLDSGYLGQLDAPSAGTVYLVGSRGPLLVTRDGGRRWQAVAPLIDENGEGTGQVQFVSPADGFVLTLGAGASEWPALWRTSDGGHRWSRRPAVLS